METVEDTCPRLKSTERMNAGNMEAAEPIRSKAGMALEAVLTLEAVLALKAVVVLEAVVDAFQRLGSAAVEDTCPEGMHVEAAAVDNCPERMHAEASRPSRIETAVEF